MKKLLKLLLLLVLYVTTFAQSNDPSIPRVSLDNIIPKSPQVAQLFRVNDITVNSAKGVPQISFTLYTATVGDVKIPVSVHYDASGIKYDDVPSAVGLKWSLSAGGNVSRSINGRPDEEYYFPNQNRIAQSNFGNWNYDTDSAQLFFQSVADNSWDIVHDQFSYNFFDKNGYFYWHKNKWWDSKNPFLTHIQSATTYRPDSLLITDEFGNKAYFGYGEYEVSSPSYSNGSYVTPNLPPSGTTSFFLKKFTTYTNQQANFSYDYYSYGYNLELSEAYVKRNGITSPDNYNCNCGSSSKSKNLLDNSFVTKVIKNITTPNEVVDFYYSTDNSLSIYKQKLDSITVKDLNTNVRKRIHFKYGKYSTVNYLRLDQVWDCSKLGDSILIAGFHYNAGTLTGVNTTSRDLFNYNNGASNGLSLISSNNSTFTANNTSADRSINATSIKNGILDTVYYPTGGKTSFDYSIHQSGTIYAPGVKIDSIKYMESNNTISMQTQYAYFDLTGGTFFTGYINNYTSDNNNPSCPTMTFNSEIENITNSSPFSFYYGKVETRRKGLTSSDTQLSQEFFTANTNCYGTPEPLLAKKLLFRNNTTTDTLSIESSSFASFTLDSLGIDLLIPPPATLPARYYYLNGYLTDNKDACKVLYYAGPGLKAILKPQQLLPVSVTKKDFDQNNSTKTLLKSLTKTYNNYWQELGYAQYNSKGIKDSTAINYLYTNGDAMATSATNANLLGLIDKVTTFAGGTQIQKGRVHYTSINNLILADSFINKTYSNAEYTDKVITAYDSLGQITEIADKQGSYTSLLRDYNKQLIVAQATGARLSQVAYTSFEAESSGGWNGINATSIVVGAALTGTKYYNQASFSISKSSLSSGDVFIVSYWTQNSNAYSVSGTQSGWPKKIKSVSRNGQTWNLYEHVVTGVTSIAVTGSGTLDELRLYPKTALMTTSAYQPLVGITAQCDPSGKISYYNYDSNTRLSYITDESGNLLKKYCYNYTGQVEDCGVACTDTTANWQTQSTTCQQSGGSNTGNQIQTQKDINTCSATYNTTRTVTVSNTSACPLPTVYAKLSIENAVIDPSYSYGDVVVRFYSNSACTVPYTVSGLNVNVQVEQYNSSTSSSSYSSYVFNCSGQSSVVFSGATLQQQYLNGGGGGLGSVDDYYTMYYTYSLLTGTGYIVVQ